MDALWKGRFAKSADQRLQEFNASITFDARLYPQDIEGSLAHSAMLAKQGIITQKDKEAIHKGLKEIREDMDQDKIVFDPHVYEDIHSAVEMLLTEKIGDAGKRLHTGRSRNDQVALDLKLWSRQAVTTLQQALLELLDVLLKLADQHKETIMPGYTHLQRAQPVTFAHVLLAYAQMFKRDLKRLAFTQDMLDEMPLGAGALAATTYPLDRDYAASLLGFSAITANSIDSVSDRDYAISILSDLSLVMMHLSRLCEEIILWSSWEYQFITLDDAFSTGSSIMPQKKNPDICELIRGKTGRVYGDLQALLVTMKGLPLAYDKDMQEDKETLFDGVDTALACLQILAPMLETMTVRKDNMKQAGQDGFINATECADYLTKKGMPFRDAYKLTGQMVAWCMEHAKSLNSMSLDELHQFSPLFDQDFYQAVDLLAAVENRNIPGGPAPCQTAKQIADLEEFAHAYAENLH